ncbi:MAG TPA: hypothetical protein VNE83_06350 [Terriglobales bacterium]|nr:hypothetical protein [Terriglobales bacterium]
MDSGLAAYETALRAHFTPGKESAAAARGARASGRLRAGMGGVSRAPAISLDLDHWWPAASPFEVIVGAILVQNTAWSNAAQAIAALRGAKRLSLAGIRELSEAELGELIRSSGFWRQKARRLRGFVTWLDAAHGGRLDRLFAQPTAAAREQLLALEGIGEETADTILLFAGDHARFVMDAYTRRVLVRHQLPAERAWVEAAVPSVHGRNAARHYRHLHALLVETAKRYCRKRAPDCGACPLAPLLPAGAYPPQAKRHAQPRLGAMGPPSRGEHKRDARPRRANPRARPRAHQ